MCTWIASECAISIIEHIKIYISIIVFLTKNNIKINPFDISYENGYFITIIKRCLFKRCNKVKIERIQFDLHSEKSSKQDLKNTWPDFREVNSYLKSNFSLALYGCEKYDVYYFTDDILIESQVVLFGKFEFEFYFINYILRNNIIKNISIEKTLENDGFKFMVKIYKEKVFEGFRPNEITILFDYSN